MTIEKISAIEGSLLNVLYEISPLAWRKYQQRYPNMWRNGSFEKIDRSAYPPYIAFRFEIENESVINRLRDLISSFSGRVIWMLDQHRRDGLPGTNWTIQPFRLKEVSGQAAKLGVMPNVYLAEYEPQFGALAYKDLEDLTQYIQRSFVDAP